MTLEASQLDAELFPAVHIPVPSLWTLITAREKSLPSHLWLRGDSEGLAMWLSGTACA